MINPFYILVGSVIIIIYGGLNYYIGLRGWQALFSFAPFLSSRVYWSALWLLSLSYVFSRFSQKYLPIMIYEGLTIAGVYWLAFMWYFLLVITALDFLRLLYRFLRLVPIKIKQGLNPVLGSIVLILVIGIVGYGAWQASHPQVRHYDLTIAKQAGPIKQLHVVLVSDIHLGTIVHNGNLFRNELIATGARTRNGFPRKISLESHLVSFQKTASFPAWFLKPERSSFLHLVI